MRTGGSLFFGACDVQLCVDSILQNLVEIQFLLYAKTRNNLINVLCALLHYRTSLNMKSVVSLLLYHIYYY